MQHTWQSHLKKKKAFQKSSYATSRGSKTAHVIARKFQYLARIYLKICITNLYPTGSPFIHAWKAESTASKCKNIRRPVRLQIIGCINKYIESDCYTFCGSLGASLSSYYKLATISNTILAMVEELHTREDITYCRTTTCYLDAKIYSLSTSKLK